MTNKEKIVVSAYTGYLMTNFTEVHKYIQEKIGRPVLTHEMALEKVQEEIREATKEDFMKLCKGNEISVGE